MAKSKASRPWVEVHMRHVASKPANFTEVHFGDYGVIGAAIPWAELHCVSDVYSMFQVIPDGFDKWFKRPIGFYDMLVLCRPVVGRRAIAHPLLVIPEEDAGRFVSPDVPVTRPKIFREGRMQETKGVILVTCSRQWSSLSKQDSN